MQIFIPAVNTDATKKEQELVYGKKGEVVCLADGFPKPKFSWYYNSSAFPPKNVPVDNGDGTLTFYNPAPGHAGKYDCILVVLQGNKMQEIEKKEAITVSVYGNEGKLNPKLIF